jgi:hypothetical protein
MNEIEKLMNRIVGRVNISLKEFSFDAAGYLKYLQDYIPLRQLIKFYAFYGINSHHPFNFHFSRSNMAGSYFLGNCKVDNAVLYKSDIRGDELKFKGDTINYQGVDFTLDLDEKIRIQDSVLIKTLVHNCSNDPANPELFLIKNSASTPYANIHGSSMEHIPMSRPGNYGSKRSTTVESGSETITVLNSPTGFLKKYWVDTYASKSVSSQQVFL